MSDEPWEFYHWGDGWLLCAKGTAVIWVHMPTAPVIGAYREWHMGGWLR